MEIRSQVCRWGILGTASIAKKNWHAILNTGNSQIIAVGSRSLISAQNFIDDCQSSAPSPTPIEAVEGYEALIMRSDIDALYIPLPTKIRTEWAIRAVQAGKHVVIEKPCGVDATDLQRILDAAKISGVQVMDGTMFAHSKRLTEIRKVLADRQQIGQIRRINTHFSFIGDQEWIQRNKDLEPAGCLGDVGWYNIRLILSAMNYQLPTQVRGRILQGVKRSDSSGITPIEFEGELIFPNGVTATLYNSFNTSRQQWAYISGSEGYLLKILFYLITLMK